MFYAANSNVREKPTPRASFPEFCQRNCYLLTYVINKCKLYFAILHLSVLKLYHFVNNFQVIIFQMKVDFLIF